MPAADATVPITDRAFLLGDGVYDTCRVFEGSYFRFDEHARRLHDSARILGIVPPAIDQLREIADDLLHRSGFDHASLRMTITRGSGGSGLGTRDAGAPRVVVTLAPMAGDWRDTARRGWTLITAGTRHPPASVMPPGLKGQGRVFALLARLEAEAAGVDDALLLSTTGHITEGPTWNVFWRRGDTLRTPSDEAGILAGVTRGLVTDVARELGMTVEHGVWPRSELDEADEIIATMTSLGLVPIRSLDGRLIPGAGEAIEPLAAAYWDRVRKETDG